MPSRELTSRSVWVLLAIPLLLAGCSGKSSHSNTAAETKKTEPSEPKVVNVGAGENTQRSSDPNRDRQWTVRWETAQLDNDASRRVGKMQQVNGVFYEKDQPMGTFQGDSGFGDQTKQVLLLKGKVRIVSNDPKLKATLYADEVRYDAHEKIVKATGNVRVESQMGTLSPMKELWATPDLKTFGTPDMFKR